MRDHERRRREVLGVDSQVQRRQQDFGPNCTDDSAIEAAADGFVAGKSRAAAIAVTDIGPCVLLDDGAVKCTTPKMLEQAFKAAATRAVR